MDRKIFLAACLVIGCGYIYYTLNAPTTPTPDYETPQELTLNESGEQSQESSPSLKNDIENGSDTEKRKSLTPPIQEMTSQKVDRPEKKQVWQTIQDFTLSPEDIFNKKEIDPEQLKQVVAQEFSSTLECLKRDYCGATPEPDTGYFDSNRTPAHITLIRLLDITRYQQKNHSPSNSVLDKEQLLEALRLNQDEIVEHALDILAPLANQNDWAEIMKIAASWDKHAAKSGFEKLAILAPRTQRQNLIQMARIRIQTSRPFDAISILEGLRDSQSLNSQEFEVLANSSCHFRQGAQHNWLAVKNNLNDISQTSGSDLSADDICH